MKNIFLKLNMAIILMIILFANISVAVTKTINNQLTIDDESVEIQRDSEHGFAKMYEFIVKQDGIYRIICEDGDSSILRVTNMSGNDIGSKDENGIIIANMTANVTYRLETNNTNKISIFSYTPTGSGDETIVDLTGDANEPEWYEKVISWFIRLLGEGLSRIISLIISEPLSIDKLVFDKYSATTLAFFNNDLDYYKTSSNPTGKNSLVGNYLEPLDQVFILFRKIAIIVYMVILVYMGLRILVMTASAGKKAKFKELILDWTKGIIILFLFPYVIRYTILINHAFVTYLYDKIGNDSEVVEENNSSLVGAVIKKNDGSLENVDTVAVDDDAVTVDYMTQMYRTAKRSRRISDAICWVIMLVQVIQFLIVYMKRLITIIFLIAIFPLVTISYAIDKIGDGKSQAFNNWYKEFVLQVFIQSFHAMNYVLVMSIILGDNANWFLKMIGIAYIAKGGDILRGLFAQMKGGAGKDGGPLEVAKAYVKTKLAIQGVNTIRQSATKLMGKDSMFGKGVERIQLARDGMSYNSSLRAERDANKALRLDFARQDAEKARKDVQNVADGIEDLEMKRDAYRNQLTDPDISEEDRRRIEEEKKKVEEEIRNYNDSLVKSVDNLSRLSEEELQNAVSAAGLTPRQIEQLQGTLNHAGAVGIIRNSRNERNIDVRTAVDVVFRDREVFASSSATGNDMLNRYITATKDEKGLQDGTLRKINAAHSITIDDAAVSARTVNPEPTETEEKVNYALDMMKNAYMGEYTLEELTRSVEIIDSVKEDARFVSMIEAAEEDVGFTFKDFKLNLAVQTINNSNRIENVGDEEAQERIDTAIDVLQSANKKTDKTILTGLKANVDELKKGYIPILREKEDERSRLQNELSKTMNERGMLGRYGEDYESYLDERISEVSRDNAKQMVGGIAESGLGIAGSAIRVTFGTAAAGVSTGATYTGGKDSAPVIVNVSNTIKTVDGAADKIEQIGATTLEATRDAGAFIGRTVVEKGFGGKLPPKAAPSSVTKSSININRAGYFKDGAVRSAVEDELKRRENVRNKMLGRRK
ncbi:MAG: hypothetical protein IJ220_05435 [Clostridia bacterium]|nr:hypothetical protein [Clostridia bacterium]